MAFLFKHFIFFFLFFSLSISPAYAQGKPWNQISPRCVANDDVATIQGLECLFANVLQAIVGIAGILFFIMFVNGGFQYLFSSGDAKKTAVASSTLTMSIIGIVGVVASFLILRLIKTFTGIEVTDFKIPGP